MRGWSTSRRLASHGRSTSPIQNNSFFLKASCGDYPQVRSPSWVHKLGARVGSTSWVHKLCLWVGEGGRGALGGLTNGRPGNWSCNLRANKKPQYKLHWSGTTCIQHSTYKVKDIVTTRLTWPGEPSQWKYYWQKWQKLCETFIALQINLENFCQFD